MPVHLKRGEKIKTFQGRSTRKEEKVR
jgi:hypothetical protein